MLEARIFDILDDDDYPYNFLNFLILFFEFHSLLTLAETNHPYSGICVGRNVIRHSIGTATEITTSLGELTRSKHCK